MKHKSLRLNQKGVALITTVLIFLVLVILLAGLLSTAILNLKKTETVKDHTAVYYAAESGIFKQMSQLQLLAEETIAKINGKTAENFPMNLADLINSINASAPLSDSLGASIDMTISGTSPNFILESDANLNEVSRRLETSFSYELGDQDVGQSIVLEEGLSSANNNSNFTFPISSLLLNNSSLDIRNCGIGDVTNNNERKVYVPTEASKARVNTNGLVCSPGISVEVKADLPGWDEIPQGFQNVVMPTYPTYTMANLSTPSAYNSSLNLSGVSNHYYINSLNMSSVNTLTLNLGNKGDNNIVNLIVNPANALTSMTADIVVSGQGKVKVYVMLRTNGNSTWDGNVTNADNDPTKFLMYAYNSSATTRLLTFANGVNFVGSLLNQGNRITLANGNIQGYLMSGCSDNGSTNYCIDVSSNTALGNTQGIWIYVPNGTVRLSSNAYILGSAIAKKLILGGSNSITEVSFKGISQDMPFTDLVDLPLLQVKVLKNVQFGNIIER